MPAGTSEVRHFHARARQFFFVLSGEAVLECGSERHSLAAHEGVEVPPGQVHRILNQAADSLRFLVISAPSTRADRVNEE